jgi:hypothetical protein
LLEAHPEEDEDPLDVDLPKMEEYVSLRFANIKKLYNIGESEADGSEDSVHNVHSQDYHGQTGSKNTVGCHSV